jgi:hypothetical protein
MKQRRKMRIDRQVLLGWSLIYTGNAREGEQEGTSQLAPFRVEAFVGLAMLDEKVTRMKEEEEEEKKKKMEMAMERRKWLVLTNIKKNSRDMLLLPRQTDDSHRFPLFMMLWYGERVL